MQTDIPHESPSNWFSLDLQQSPYFENNFARLCRKEPNLAELLDSFKSAIDAYQFLPIGKQRYACRMQAEIIYDPSGFPAALQRSLDNAHSFMRRGAQLLLLAGTGLGYLAVHLEAEIRGDYSQGLILLENRPELILAQLGLFDCRSLLESPQVLWAVGENLRSRLLILIEREGLYQLRDNCIALVPERGMTAEEKKMYQQIGGGFRWFQNRILPQMQEKKANFDLRMKQSPNWESGGIWAAATPDAYAHTPLIRSLLAGFTKLGWKSHLLEIQDGFTTRFRVAEDLIRSAPDVILVCNSASETFLSREIPRPRICWILDNPRHYDPQSLKNRLGHWDYVFYIDRTFTDFFQNTAARQSRFLPATAAILSPGEYRANYAAPMVFVGAYDPVTAALESLPLSAREACTVLLEYRIEHPQKTAAESIQALEISESIVDSLRDKARLFTGRLHRKFSDEAAALDYYLYALANSWKREKYVRSLLDRGLEVYGPESWLHVMGVHYASQYRGPLSSERLADVYASAQICLNLHSLQCPTCFNPRDFDVLAASGCLLSDFVEDMDQGFLVDGKDFLSFRTVEELQAQTERLLEDSALRESLRLQGYQTYRERHTPSQRAQEMVRIIKADYASAGEGL